MNHSSPGEDAKRKPDEGGWEIRRLVYGRIRELGFTSLRTFEKARGYKANALHYPIRDDKLGKWPQLEHVNRLAQALDLTTEVVSAAFARDLKGPDGNAVIADHRSPAQRAMDEVLATMSEPDRWEAVQHAKLVAEHSRARAAALRRTTEL
ncbi:hypothetical protein ACQPZF_03660 [Actinosynnema sp. CS-041913]|uniref:hypothetical protein n=1 Tax=Actinosynnema sp. CS-041913 TaxID=3239917 RepID=UPI003D930B4E